MAIINNTNNTTINTIIENLTIGGDFVNDNGSSYKVLAKDSKHDVLLLVSSGGTYNVATGIREGCWSYGHYFQDFQSASTYFNRVTEMPSEKEEIAKKLVTLWANAVHELGLSKKVDDDSFEETQWDFAQYLAALSEVFHELFEFEVPDYWVHKDLSTNEDVLNFIKEESERFTGI